MKETTTKIKQRRLRKITVQGAIETSKINLKLPQLFRILGAPIIFLSTLQD